MRQILDYLAARQIWHRRLNSGVAMLPGRGGRMRPVRFGAPGMPDILARRRDGSVVWIEAKSATARQSPEQVAWQHDAEQFGDTYILARCVEDVIAVFETRTPGDKPGKQCRPSRKGGRSAIGDGRLPRRV